MHVISRKALRDFSRRHPDSESALNAWFKIMSLNSFNNFVELRQTFPNADMVDGLVVFNIKGNHYRLAASVHFNRGKVYVRRVMTHKDYDKGGWKE